MVIKERFLQVWDEHIFFQCDPTDNPSSNRLSHVIGLSMIISSFNLDNIKKYEKHSFTDYECVY
jgi:hypothetical protein